MTMRNETSHAFGSCKTSPSGSYLQRDPCRQRHQSDPSRHDRDCLWNMARLDSQSSTRLSEAGRPRPLEVWLSLSTSEAGQTSCSAWTIQSVPASGHPCHTR